VRKRKSFASRNFAPCVRIIPAVPFVRSIGLECAPDPRQDIIGRMTKPITQSVKFRASPKELYQIYTDPKLHTKVTGGPVTISSKPNSKFSAFGKMIWGETLFTIPNKLIVQRWRSMNFKKSDLDSILILEFSRQGKQGRIHLVHVNVPEQDHAGVTSGWKKYYWGPLRRYLKSG
jgi:activator of HSP90 ATPase